MDRDRLKEVRQTDLTESRVNEEFVDWLKTKGLSWLFVVLLMVCVYLLIVRWRQHKDAYKNEAWAAFVESEQSGLPSSFTDVADEYADVDGIGQLANLRAADRLLSSVQIGRALGSEEGTPTPLSDQERLNYLERADRLYAAIVEGDDGTLGMALFVIGANNGRAAIAESRGEFDEAARLYRESAARAEGIYPALADQARRRADSMNEALPMVDLPSNLDPEMTRPTPLRGTRAVLEPALRELLLPTDS